MSPVHKKTSHAHSSTKKKAAPAVANVFDDNDPTQSPRRPMVVEIEDTPVSEASLPRPTEVSVEPQVAAPMQPQSMPTPADANVTAVPMPMTATQGSVPPVSAQAPIQTGMSNDPVLPSFFAQDLQGNAQMGMSGAAQPTQAEGGPGAPLSGQSIPTDGVLPQAMVGEINEMSGEGGGNTKKIIGIVLIVVALVLLVVGALVVYAKRLSEPVVVPTPEPTSIPVASPTPALSATPVASGSASSTATGSGTLTDLKKKVKVDVLNGTKVAGLASKQAAVIKAGGYTTGTVGNGDADEAGTIVIPTGYATVAADLQKLLADFTFTITEDKAAKNVVVTLGEPKE